MPDGVEISTDQVGVFAKGMRAEAGQGFSQAAVRGSELHWHGVEFGASLSTSEVVEAAKKKYATALENTDANLRAYQQAAGIFADVAEQIARDFDLSDRSSAEAAKRVDALLGAAIVKVDAALASAQAAARKAI